MSHIALISGSPTAPSRSAHLLDRVEASLARQRIETRRVDVRALPASALLLAQHRDPTIAAAVADVESADAIVIATPVYKASFSGLLKVFLDLLSQDALHGKIVLPIATGGSLAHLLSLDYALRPVLSALGARHATSNVFAVDGQLPKGADGRYSIDDVLAERLDDAVRELTRTLSDRAELLAHRASAQARQARALETARPTQRPANATARASHVGESDHCGTGALSH
ncbi:NADPH-dependent FMN reductase [Chitinasiproducens palmae]|uniref:FMN reductase n=1 Tax=Chitinasiproducens palmae TaxID=1770053 RepID=A0A1H2PQ43_9BURK|nr:NADPH-dependent FMN reductase [Chitinasiproducens palmae]SDV48939.1 FMN reductase [Chitinasiproducens palmae]